MKRYFITGDHPILKRPDKIVDESLLQLYLTELRLNKFENIRYHEYPDGEWINAQTQAS
jgi:hypothetical protein